MSDLIKREDAIDAVIEWYGCKPNDIEAFEKIIEAIPSADRPQGEWIRRDYWSEGVGMGESYGFYYECSNCGEQQKGGYGNCGMKYCPDCGARMKGADDEVLRQL